MIDWWINLGSLRENGHSRHRVGHSRMEMRTCLRQTSIRRCWGGVRCLGGATRYWLGRHERKEVRVPLRLDGWQPTLDAGPRRPGRIYHNFWILNASGWGRFILFFFSQVLLIFAVSFHTALILIQRKKSYYGAISILTLHDTKSAALSLSCSKARIF